MTVGVDRSSNGRDQARHCFSARAPNTHPLWQAGRTTWREDKRAEERVPLKTLYEAQIIDFLFIFSRN